MLGSAYGPSGDTPADQVERENLFATLGSAVGGAADNKVLLIGIDANVSVGPDASSAAVSFDDKRSWRAYRKPCGKFGLKRGKKLKRDTFLGFLRSQEWCLANTFFPGPSASVEPLGTWLGVHPKRRVWHQLDYWKEHGWTLHLQCHATLQHNHSAVLHRRIKRVLRTTIVHCNGRCDAQQRGLPVRRPKYKMHWWACRLRAILPRNFKHVL